MKKIMTVILMMILLLCVQSISAYDGTCGVNGSVAYTINQDTHTISFTKAVSGQDAVWNSDCGTFANQESIKIIRVDDPIRVTDASYMFSEFRFAEEMYLSKLDVSNVADMSYMFGAFYDDYEQYYISKLNILDVSGWNTSNVTNMDVMFQGCSSLTALDLSTWKTSNVTGMSNVFQDCSSLTALNAGGWDTSNVTAMAQMFQGCSSLTALDLSAWKTSNVTNMNEMFQGCSSLTALDLSGWDTSNLYSMGEMFGGCRSLTALDVSGWDTSNVTIGYDAFQNCRSLQTISLGKYTLAQNIFTSLPGYDADWYYIAPGPDAGNPIAPGSIRTNAALFTDFQAGKMAGIWSTYSAEGKRLTLPSGLKEIGKSAFEGAASVEAVILPYGLTKIGSKAFADCGKLKLIYVPDSVSSIADDAFKNTVNPVFVCQSDNDGAAYAREHNIAYIIARQ